MQVDDARGNVAQSNVYAMGGAALKTTSVDAGRRWALVDVVGGALRVWDDEEREYSWSYDELRRPVVTVQGDR